MFEFITHSQGNGPGAAGRLLLAYGDTELNSWKLVIRGNYIYLITRGLIVVIIVYDINSKTLEWVSRF